MINDIYKQLNYQIGDLNPLTSDVHTVTDPTAVLWQSLHRDQRLNVHEYPNNPTSATAGLVLCAQTSRHGPNRAGHLSRSRLKQFALQLHESSSQSNQTSSGYKVPRFLNGDEHISCSPRKCEGIVQ